MAFLTDPRTEPMFRVPGVVVFLIVLLVGIEVSREFVWSGATDAIFQKYGFVPQQTSSDWNAAQAGHFHLGDAISRIVPWLSYSFFHRNMTRVLLFSVLIFAFGPVTARRIGAVPFLALYLVCGAAAAAAHLALHWSLALPLVGAAGASAGCIGAGIRLLGREEVDDEVLRSLTDRTVISFSLFWLLFSVVCGVMGIGAAGFFWEVPVGGYLAGLLLIGLLDRPPPPEIGVPGA